MLPEQDIARQLTNIQKRLESLERQRSGADRLIDSAVLAADATVLFSNIPNIYAHLLILYYVRSDRAATSDNVSMRFNGDAGNNYDFFQAAMSTGGIGASSLIATSAARVGGIIGATSPANTYSTGRVRIHYYANSSNHKSLLFDSTGKIANAAASVFRVSGSSWWRNVAAITSINIFPELGTDFLAGSRFDLYGIQGG